LTKSVFLFFISAYTQTIILSLAYSVYERNKPGKQLRSLITRQSVRNTFCFKLGQTLSNFSLFTFFLPLNLFVFSLLSSQSDLIAVCGSYSIKLQKKRQKDRRKEGKSLKRLFLFPTHPARHRGGKGAFMMNNRDPCMTAKESRWEA
jgi:hypothetical protein